MRIVLVDTYYPAFLDQHYADSPGLDGRPYEEQLASLMGRFFGTSDAYSRHLRELGHDAVDIIANCHFLQSSWTAERGRPGRLRRVAARLPLLPARRGNSGFLQEVAVAQIEEFDAEVVYMQNLSFFNRSTLNRFRSQGRLVVGQVASGLPAADLLRGFDLILTSFPHYPDRLRALGVDSEYLPIAFYERVLDRLRADGVDPGADSRRAHDITFVGGLDRSVHRERVDLLETIASCLPLEVWSYGAEGLLPESALTRAHRGSAWGIDMYRVLAMSRIVLNRHINYAEGYANNMRLFEATGVGALLMTESAPNLADFFEPGREVVSYDGPADLVEKLRHYNEHDDERRAIAAAGQRRTLRDHTYGGLMVRLADILEARRQ